MLKPTSYALNCAGVNGTSLSVNLLSSRQAETIFASQDLLNCHPMGLSVECQKSMSAIECQAHRIRDASLFP